MQELTLAEIDEVDGAGFAQVVFPSGFVGASTEGGVYAAWVNVPGYQTRVTYPHG